MKIIFTIFFLIFKCIADQSETFDIDAYIETKERLHKIPHKLLKAIALTESGRMIDNNHTPWSWTINSDNKSYFFDDKKSAIEFVKKIKNTGRCSVDVGCMQVNLKYHPKAFNSLEDSFDPKKNIDYAAKFLSDLYSQHQDWMKAIGYYHSYTPKFYRIYQQKVLQQWKKILGIDCSKKKNVMQNNANSKFKSQPARKINHSHKEVKFKAVMRKTFIPLDSSKINSFSLEKTNHKKYMPLDSKSKNHFIKVS